MKRITTITIIIAVITIILAVVAFTRIEKVKHENADLRNYNKQLEVNLTIKNMQVNDLQDELTGCYQELENVKINYYSDQMIMKELKHRYFITKSRYVG
jgi:YbbR domain-containing protein